jgi:hypothetical protein
MTPAVALAQGGSRVSASDFGKPIGVVRSNPIAVVAGAVAIGVVIGVLGRRN